MASIHVAAEGGGLREQNKRDKLARIIDAARELFGRNGIELTTLREVAAAAKIGAGTLFLYARSKEDLLVLVFLTELQPVIDSGFRNIPKGTLLLQLMHSFRPIVEHHSRNLRLSRPFLRDVAWVSEAHANTIRVFIESWNLQVIRLIDAAKERGQIRRDVDSLLLANCARQLFLAPLRSWVAGWTSREQCDHTVLANLQLLLDGLRPSGGRRSKRGKTRARKRTR